MRCRHSFHFVFLLFSLEVFCAATAIASPAQTLTTLVSFDGTNGAGPQSSLIQGSDGNFYGTTTYGGANDAPACNFGILVGCGTVFKITPGGTLTTLYSFCAQSNCTDGANPYGGLVQATDGNFYGTTYQGGAVANCGGIFGCGTVFKITPGGTLTTLYSFCAQSNCTDGVYPYAGLVQATDGNFYGTAWGGGASSAYCPNGCGTVFKITSAGTLTTLHSFDNADGVYPYAALVQAADGNFYSTTLGGGAYGLGTVFKITPAGALTTLYTFCSQIGCTDGQSPYAGLVQAADGNFYSTTTGGGANARGTVFRITPGGTLTTLYSFCSHIVCSDGAQPRDGLVQGTDGNLYGTTSTGGPGYNAQGTVFRITSWGLLNTLYTFCSQPNCTDGASPIAGLVQATDGNFYGNTSAGGANQVGTVFSLSAPSPIVWQFVPVTPCRLLDTRTGYGGPIQGGTSEPFNLPQLALEQGCADLSTAAAYSLNVTVVPPGPLGYLTIWPTGETQPVVSTLNSLDGRVKANAAIVPASNNAVSVFVSNTTDVVLDIDGYFAPVSNSTLAFYPLTPCRVADTRPNSGFPQGLGPPSLSGGMPRDFPILMSNCGIPKTAQAYSFNFTAVPPGPLGYLTVWPFGQMQPVVSTLNDVTGTVVANAAIVPAGTDGEGSIEAFASNNTDLVIDINGYFAPAGLNGLSLYPVAPCRVLDTRQVGNGQPFVDELTVDVADSVCGPSKMAQAYIFNATVVPPGPLGYLTLWPDNGSPPPVASTLNAIDGAVTSNMAIVPTTDGSIDAFASNLTQLILDISAYFAPQVVR